MSNRTRLRGSVRGQLISSCCKLLWTMCYILSARESNLKPPTRIAMSLTTSRLSIFLASFEPCQSAHSPLRSQRLQGRVLLAEAEEEQRSS